MGRAPTLPAAARRTGAALATRITPFLAGLVPVGVACVRDVAEKKAARA